MLRYQRLGVSADGDKIISSLLLDLPTPENQSLLKKRIKDIDTRFAYTVRACVYLAWYKHVQYMLPLDIEIYLSYAIPAAIEYFFGEYRNNYRKFPNDPPYNRETSRIYIPWVDTFCNGIACALWLGDRVAVQKIASYVDNDVVLNDQDGDMWVCVLIAKFLCGESLQKNRHIIDIIHNQRFNRPKLLFDILESIESNPKDIGRNMIRYVKHFLKYEANKTYYMAQHSIMATVLFETARFFGRDLPDLPEKIADRIITRESLGLSTYQERNK